MTTHQKQSYLVLLGYFLLIMGIVVIDRLTKWWALHNAVEPVLINSFLRFELTYNRGISFGMFHSENDIVFFIVSGLIALITLAISYYAYNQYIQNKNILGFVMVIAGSIANSIDRMLHGGVIDFICVLYKGWSFPIFNIADISIVVGAFIIFLRLRAYE